MYKRQVKKEAKEIKKEVAAKAAAATPAAAAVPKMPPAVVLDEVRGNRSWLTIDHREKITRQRLATYNVAHVHPAGERPHYVEWMVSFFGALAVAWCV